MILYRITRERYAQSLSGKGAEMYGGRWNSAGLPVVYCSYSRPLAMLESLAWTSMSLLVTGDFVLLTLDCDDSSIEKVDVDSLPAGWTSVNAYPACRKIGDQWLREARSLLLKVPSAILPEEYNVLINPAHRLISSVSIAEVYDIRFDPRVIANVRT